jgi:glutamyl-tRNA reductase
MERIAVAGLSLHETDVAGIERLSRPTPGAAEVRLRELADALAASELVLLATCNRVEVIFARESGHLPGASDRTDVASALGLAAGDALRARMHLHTGVDAVRYLFRIAASLESVVVGEDQILAQVREAYARSEAIGLCGRLLGTTFEHAFQVGKLVRTRTELARRPVSVVSLGVAAIAQRFEGARPRLALLGAGEMAGLFVQCARERGLAVDVIANRSPERARALAGTCGARVLSLDGLLSSGEAFDALAAATSAPGFVIQAEELRALAQRAPLRRGFLAVDLAVPRDLEPTEHPLLEIVDLDRLRGLAQENRARRAEEAFQAELLIEQKLDTFACKAARQTFDATLADVQHESSGVFERELAQLFTGRLAALAEPDRRAIERWARAAFGRVSHVPINAIKRLASDATLFGARGADAQERS